VQLHHGNGTGAQRWTYDADTKEIKVSGTEPCLCTRSAAQQWTHA